MDKQSVVYDPTYYSIQKLPPMGCFGYVNGHLILGTGHHQAIMAALIQKGWTWEQLMDAEQAWGWFHVGVLSFFNKQEEQYVTRTAVEVRFTSDAGYQNEDAVTRAKGAFAQLYHLVVKDEYSDSEGNPITRAVDESGREYGAGISGIENIDRYLDDGHQQWYKDRLRYIKERQELPKPPKESARFEDDPTYWKKKGLPESGCFGFINGHLVLGMYHHQAIMAKLIEAGWTWEQLMAAPQAWGWFWVRSKKDFDNYYSTDDAALWLSFTSDAGYQNEDELNRAGITFATLYHLPIKYYDLSLTRGIDPEGKGREYGSGLRGRDFMDGYLNEEGTRRSLLDDIQDVPPPPKESAFTLDNQTYDLYPVPTKFEKPVKTVIMPNTTYVDPDHSSWIWDPHKEVLYFMVGGHHQYMMEKQPFKRHMDNYDEDWFGALTYGDIKNNKLRIRDETPEPPENVWNKLKSMRKQLMDGQLMNRLSKEAATNPINYDFIPFTNFELDAYDELAPDDQEYWKKRAKNINHVAQKQGVKGTITPKQLNALAQRYDDRCAYCDKKLDWIDNGTFDHVIPKWLGGTNVISNLLPACILCNHGLDTLDRYNNSDRLAPPHPQIPSDFQSVPVTASMQKFSTWRDIMDKAQRLRRDGKVQLQYNGAQHVEGVVQGDHGTYDTSFERQDPNSGAITLWNCTCPWAEYSWGRTRQWKKYEGRPCAHTLALYWESLSNPLSQEMPGGGQLPGNPGQNMMQAPPEPPPTPPGGPNTAPPGGATDIGTTPSAAPPEAAPPTTSPAGSQPKGVVPPEQSTINFPGALSRVADNSLDDWEKFYYHPDTGWQHFPYWGNDHYDHYHDNYGLDEVPIMGVSTGSGVDAWIESDSKTPDEVVDYMKQRYPNQHSYQVYKTREGWYRLKGNDLVKDSHLPALSKVAQYANGDIVRAKVPLYGTEPSTGTEFVIPESSSGEIIYSDPEESIVIFPLASGPLEPHLVKVYCDTDELYLDQKAQPFVKKRGVVFAPPPQPVLPTGFAPPLKEVQQQQAPNKYNVKINVGNLPIDIQGGTLKEQQQVVNALTTAHWPFQFQQKIKVIISAQDSEAQVGTIVLTKSLLDSGKFAYGTILHEFCHEVDFWLLDDQARQQLMPTFGAQKWWSNAASHDPKSGMERFASTLAYALWPTAQNTNAQEAIKTIPPAQFLATVQQLINQKTGSLGWIEVKNYLDSRQPGWVHATDVAHKFDISTVSATQLLETLVKRDLAHRGVTEEGQPIYTSLQVNESEPRGTYV